MWGLAQMPLNIKTPKSCLKCDIFFNVTCFIVLSFRYRKPWFMVYGLSHFGFPKSSRLGRKKIKAGMFCFTQIKFKSVCSQHIKKCERIYWWDKSIRVETSSVELPSPQVDTHMLFSSLELMRSINGMKARTRFDQRCFLFPANSF